MTVQFTLRATLMATTAAFVLAGPAMAQTPPAAGPEAASEVDEIVVTGVRGSLTRALEQKRRSSAITDGVSSKDLMDYPDLNVADSLQRITGVTVERTMGEARSIAVRGLASEFTRVTINGQGVVSGSGGREIDFNIFASELFNSVRVVKSHSASLSEGGLAGTVDLRTARPFDFRGPAFGVSAQWVGNDLAEDYRPRLSALASTTLADGRIGVLGSISYSELALRQDNAEGLRFIQTNIDANQDGVVDTNGVEYPFIPRYVNENIGRERLGVTGAVQFRPSDAFELTLDVAYAKVDEERRRYSMDGQINAANIRSPLSTPTIDSTGLIVDATLGGVASRSENILTPQADDLLLLNTDARWSLSDTLTLHGKVGYSEATRDTREFRSTWASTGNFRYAIQPDRNFFLIEGVGRNLGDASIYNSHEARFINTETSDNETSAQFDLEWITHSFVSAIKAGVRFEDREKDTIQFDGRATASTNFAPFARALPVDNFFAGSNNAAILRNWPVADFDAVLRSTALIPAGFTPPQRVIATNTVTEQSLAGYVQADIDTTLFGALPVRGDIGVRFVSTDQSSTGYPTNTTQITVESDYAETLPSLNLIFDLRDDLLLRASAGRSLTRPTITDLTPGGTVAVGVPTASFGNPLLSPYTAWNYDLSLEWYFAPESLISVALYDKEIQGFVTRVSAPEVLGADVLGVGDPRAGSSFLVSRPINGDDAYVRGFEVSVQAPLSFLPVEGFGVVANYTYADSESSITFGGRTLSTLLRGQSRSSYNLVGYYEAGPISTRLAYAWRDSYLDEVRAAATERSNFINDYGQLDASFQYAFAERLVLSVDALNVLDEKQHRYAETTDRTIRYSQTGRYFQIGLRAKF